MCKIRDPSHGYEFVLRSLTLLHVRNLAVVSQRKTLPTSTHTLSHARCQAATGRLATARLDRKVSPDAEPLQECPPECAEA
jgi:hypothetical protein